MSRHEKIIQLRVKRLTGIQKIIGLIGKEKPEAVYFQTKWGIHTFGLKFPIDVLILNKESRVATLRKSLRPNHIFIWNPRYEQVIELPKGTIAKMKITIGQAVRLK